MLLLGCFPEVELNNNLVCLLAHAALPRARREEDCSLSIDGDRLPVFGALATVHGCQQTDSLDAQFGEPRAAADAEFEEEDCESDRMKSSRKRKTESY